MRFSLQDIKRQIRRRGDLLTITLHFLRPGELRTEIAGLIAWHEQHCQRPRKDFLLDEASALIGDYRLAACLLPTLSAWYTWQQPVWTAVLDTLSVAAQMALEEHELRSAVALRLAFFDYVNAGYAGFLAGPTREQAMGEFAALYQLDLARLEYMLALDSDDEAILTRIVPEPPTADAVAALYNQWAFEAALCNASEVQFVIDCEAFLAAQRNVLPGAVTGIGAVVKRLCYLARRLGVYYDLAYEDPSSSQQTKRLHLTLYGPQEMSGSPQQYGQRLARLCRILLGLGVGSASRTGRSRQTAEALTKAICQAGATIHLFQKAYHFQLEAPLLALLPSSAPAAEVDPQRVSEATSVYDSTIEQHFAEAFAALERGNGVDGWRLEREPEPLLLVEEAGMTQTRGIFIPDFALTRGEQHVYVEILGFWTPAYRERKVHKLQLLKGRSDLILAFPVDAHATFAALASDFPLIEYRTQLSATELLRVLQTRYDDFAQRLARLDAAHVQSAVLHAQFIPERACYSLLACYRRSELPLAAATVLTSEMAYAPGLGLYLSSWLEHIHVSFVEWIEALGQYRLPLSDIIQACRTRWPELGQCDEHMLETLLALWPEVEVQRDSIFEAMLVVEMHSEQAQSETEETSSGVGAQSTLPVRAARERRKKRTPQETSQQNLWE